MKKIMMIINIRIMKNMKIILMTKFIMISIQKLN